MRTVARTYQPAWTADWRASIVVVPLAVVMMNFATSSVTPVTAFPWDDLFLFDGIWRVAQGQIAGVDFYNPLGFGPFHLAAVFWRALGPNRAALPFAIAVINAAITLCASTIVTRRPHLNGPPGLLICVVIALEASAPSVYGWSFWAIGTAAFYNRLTTAALAVLLLQWFTAPEQPDRKTRAMEVALAACLLNILFLVKISALGLGFGIILAALLVRSDWRSMLLTQLVPGALLLAVFIAADFACSGVPPRAVLGLYQRAAEVRASLASFDALPRALAGWMTFVGLAILAIQTVALALDGVSRWRLFVLIGCYLLFQTALNVSNTQPGTAFLAPACAAVLWQWHRARGTRAARRDLGDGAARIVACLVGVPDALAVVFAACLTALSAAHVVVPVVISGEAGLALPVTQDFRGGDQTTQHAEAVNQGLRDLRQLGLERRKIASLDYDNPFPAMLAAPSPRRVDVVLAPGYMERGDKPFDPDEIVGDACVLMVPRQPAPVIEDSAEFLTGSVAPVLRSAFTLVRRDAAWEIYRARGSCPD
jgi:hypothetical protein